MNAYEKMMDTIKAEEQLLRVEHFSNQDAFDLGCFLVEEAKKQGIAMAVAVRKPTGAILFHHLMAGTNFNNQNWMRRKYNTVLLWEHSSLYAWAHEHISGESIEEHGFSKAEYIQCGGGFPIFMKSGELVGVLTVSNLPHIGDHNFAVAAFAKWLGVENVPLAEEI